MVAAHRDDTAAVDRGVEGLDGFWLWLWLRFFGFWLWFFGFWVWFWLRFFGFWVFGLQLRFKVQVQAWVPARDRDPPAPGLPRWSPS